MAGYSGLWDGHYNTPHSLLANDLTLRKKISRILRKPGARKLKELMLELNGAAAGAPAAASYKRVAAEANFSPASNGGVRTIETVTVINRNTNAADEAAIDTMLNQKFALSPSQYPVDESGNAGGGKLGY